MRRRALEIKKRNQLGGSGINHAKVSNGLEGALTKMISGNRNPMGTLSGGPAISSADGLRNSLRNYIITQDRQLLSQAYAEIGLVQTICKVPVEDALKGGVDIITNELTPDEITELKTSFENEDMSTVIQAGVWQRLFGGSGILVLTEQEPEVDLSLKAIKSDSYLEFRAVDRWELYLSDVNKHEFDDSFDRYLKLVEEKPHYDYYGRRVNKSRVIPIKGDIPPSAIRNTTTAWGLSVVEALLRSLNQYIKSTNLIHEVLDEFKIDIFKMFEMAKLLELPDGEAKVMQRLMLAQMNKNYLNGLAMDSQDDWDHKQLNFSGIADTMAGIRMQVASDMRMPMTKLFGISAAGFNSGEDDIEVYNSMVESSIRHRLRNPIIQILRLKCKKMFGFIPKDLAIAFKPLREMTSEQVETVKTNKFNRLDRARTLGEITSKEFREACNKDDLLPIKLKAISIPDQNEDEGTADDPEEDDDEENEEESYNNDVGGLRYIKRRNSLDYSVDKPNILRTIRQALKNILIWWR